MKKCAAQKEKWEGKEVDKGKEHDKWFGFLAYVNYLKW